MAHDAESDGVARTKRSLQATRSAVSWIGWILLFGLFAVQAIGHAYDWRIVAAYLVAIGIVSLGLRRWMAVRDAKQVEALPAGSDAESVQTCLLALVSRSAALREAATRILVQSLPHMSAVEIRNLLQLAGPDYVLALFTTTSKPKQYPPELVVALLDVAYRSGNDRELKAAKLVAAKRAESEVRAAAQRCVELLHKQEKSEQEERLLLRSTNDRPEEDFLLRPQTTPPPADAQQLLRAHAAGGEEIL